jgi:anti-sigma factor RsiW
MSVHLSIEAIDRYHRRTLPPAALSAVDDHLAQCPECRARLAREVKAAPLVRRLRQDLMAELTVEPFHLDWEQCASYVDGELDPVDREIVESHLEHCLRCVAEVGELHAFKARMSVYPTAAHAPAPAAPAPAPAAPAPAPAAPSRSKIVDLFRRPLVWLPIAAAGTAAVLFLLSAQPPKPPAPHAARVPDPGAPHSGDPANPHPVIPPSFPTRDERASAQNLQLGQGEPQVPTAQPNGAVAPPKPQGNTPPVTAERAVPTSGSAPLPQVAGARSHGTAVEKERHALLAEFTSRRTRYPEEQAVRRFLLEGRLHTPAILASLVGLSGALRGGPAEAGPLVVQCPVGTVVLSTRPEFEWTPVDNATGYRVTVYNSAMEEVAESGLISKAEWMPPQPLSRGKTYQWQVQALDGEEEIARAPRLPAPEAKFHVLDKQMTARVERLERKYASSPAAGTNRSEDEPGSAYASALILCVSYAEAGLLDDAERESLRLVALDPDSPLAQELRQSIRKFRDRAP